MFYDEFRILSACGLEFDTNESKAEHERTCQECEAAWTDVLESFEIAVDFAETIQAERDHLDQFQF